MWLKICSLMSNRVGGSGMDASNMDPPVIKKTTLTGIGRPKKLVALLSLKNYLHCRDGL